ncbi:11839_t:CDS:2 [Ambispora leptoticha]|uniref:11839_t:CDS:1 n=1 Tax=Ambispora leptoticha TaxID=144679 RepID=A0A9N9BJX6_9GLOM|nr:11839_t:CDS:2 [Ambispora leptoticha]
MSHMLCTFLHSQNAQKSSDLGLKDWKPGRPTKTHYFTLPHVYAQLFGHTVLRDLDRGEAYQGTVSKIL